MDLKNLKINFLGDSITEGAGASDQSKCYVECLARDYGAICRNYGIGGTRIARQKSPSELSEFDKDFPSRVAGMNEDADVVIIFGGTNDYGHGDAPIGEFSDRTTDTFYGALHTLYTDIINKYPAALILVLTPLHRDNEDAPNVNNATLYDYVRIIREVAQYYSLPVVDLYASSGIQPQLPVLHEKYTTDGLHPNDLGHKRVSKIIASYLKSVEI